MADPALGAVRTMRQHLIVAGTINSVCTGLPGAPKVTALSDGWMMSGPSGASWQCHTVEELWAAVIAGLGGTPQLIRLLGRQEAYAVDPENAGLPSRVAAIGRTLTSTAAAPRPALCAVG
ncbi:hypothetical protein [Arthrobacter sp. UYEF20]|uniref:hypothetical protein n=1 Tax=Arthrobacter sp. UYEF20 TaxID=1756363 RepID=UPI003399DD65